MHINDSTKRYWARTGPNQIFGSDWQERKDMTDQRAERRFDQVWQDELEPAILAGKKISASRAQAMVPQDGRSKYFDSSQEHRECQLYGSTLLVQIDTVTDTLTQLWHLNKKAPTSAPSTRPSRTRPTAIDNTGSDFLETLAFLTGISEEQVADEIRKIVASGLVTL